MRALLWSVSLAALGLTACSGESNPSSSKREAPEEEVGCKVDGDCAATPETPLCEVETGSCSALPPGHQIGWKDGAADSVALVPIYEPDKLREPTDLAFNPSNPSELWVVNRKDDSMIIISNPGMPEVGWQRRHDPAADHFMARPPAFAFGAVSPEWGQTFGICGDSDNGGDDFMGAALFTADPDVFAKPTADGLGSHLDMLHSTTFCRGIAHVQENVFFTFNSSRKSLDKYDFRSDHGPGNDDHSDGEIYRYVAGSVLGVEGTSSHLAYYPADLGLYVADTGNKRIAKLDTQSGTIGSSFSGLEPVKARKNVNDAAIIDVVPPGTLESPSGIEIHDDLIFVTDAATSRFYCFDVTGQLIRSLDTGLPAGSLSGFTFGPDDRIYFVDVISSWVYRIDPLF